ncbi:hypothetical protein [Rhizobium sp. FY34]|uniref:hypothetical protein n=1 Tax=Rhizobium sp. FY34 TaxID=2562309 RepID=UPI0010C03C59|nr:hypothetical protein [Rhizobium sp. FY34]
MIEDSGRHGPNDRSQANLAYIRQMLGELRNVALRENAHLLSYLIEMAYVEAGDLQDGARPISNKHDERH